MSNKNNDYFQIIQIVNSHVYRFRLFKDWIVHDVFHTSLLKKIANDSLFNQLFFESFSNYIDNDNDEY